MPPYILQSETDWRDSYRKIDRGGKTVCSHVLRQSPRSTNRQDGYLEGNGYLVSWCIGHLVELAPPNVYDAKYVKWSIADLPILPERWQYLVSASTKKQFGILQKLMHRPDVDSIVNSCDAG